MTDPIKRFRRRRAQALSTLTSLLAIEGGQRAWLIVAISVFLVPVAFAISCTGKLRTQDGQAVRVFFVGTDLLQSGVRRDCPQNAVEELGIELQRSVSRSGLEYSVVETPDLFVPGKAHYLVRYELRGCRIERRGMLTRRTVLTRLSVLSSEEKAAKEKSVMGESIESWERAIELNAIHMAEKLFTHIEKRHSFL